MLPLSPGDADHEETNSTQHRDNHKQQKENRPASSITATGNHSDTASGASEEMGNWIHEVRISLKDIIDECG